MRNYKILPGARTLSRLVDIPPEVKRRLKWFDWYEAHGRNARLTCRHFGISPDTFYRWKRRYRPGKPQTFQDRSRKPHTFRQSSIPQETVKLIVRLRREEMGLSKCKLHQILKRDHEIVLSLSSIGRILKKKGLIDEAETIRSVKRRKKINYVIPRLRAAKQLRYKHPGYLVQIDTKHLIVLDQHFYQFTTLGCYTKVGFSRIYKRASSSGADFLKSLLEYFPFKVKAVQTDNGAKFLLHFHKECVARGITHYFSYPKTPKDNALVERMIQTTEYELWLFDKTLIPELAYLNQKMVWWVGRYNNYRPHQSLK